MLLVNFKNLQELIEHLKSFNESPQFAKGLNKQKQWEDIPLKRLEESLKTDFLKVFIQFERRRVFLDSSGNVLDWNA